MKTSLWLVGSRSWKQFVGASVLGLLLSLTVLVAVLDVEARPFLSSAALAVFAVAFLVAVSATWNRCLSRSFLVAVAVVLRLLALGLPLALSDDVYRYLWDGRVARAGFNPWIEAPDSPRLEELRDPLWEQMPHREVETVYPPVALLFFSIAGHFVHPVLVWRTFLTVLDVASCWLLVSLLIRAGAPTGRAVGYLWSPLVVVEISGMGHVDALGVLPLLAAIWLIGDRAGADQRSGHSLPLPSSLRVAGSAVLLGVSVGAKLVPLILVPLWAKLSRRRLVFVATGGAVLSALFVPLLFSTGGLPPGLVTYGVSWEFNGPLYEPLWRLLDFLGVSQATKAGLDGVKDLTGLHEHVNGLYHLVYPQLLAKGMLGVAFFAALFAAMRRRTLTEGTLLALGAFLLCSATVYPWYLVWLLPLACLEARAHWLVLSVTLLGAYAPVFFGVLLFPWVYLGVWAPPVLFFWYSRRHAASFDTVVSG